MQNWKPRWYYIYRNKTTGKLYLGQTQRASLDKYNGSGTYWKNHCKKNGGLNKSNIETVWCEWFENEDDVRTFLKSFFEEEGEYWLFENKKWANRVPETTEASDLVSWNATLTEEQKRLQCSEAGKVGGKYSGPTKSHWGNRDKDLHSKLSKRGGQNRHQKMKEEQPEEYEKYLENLRQQAYSKTRYRVEIDGAIYDGQAIAARSLGVAPTTITAWVKNGRATRL